MCVCVCECVSDTVEKAAGWKERRGKKKKKEGGGKEGRKRYPMWCQPIPPPFLDSVCSRHVAAPLCLVRLHVGSEDARDLVHGCSTPGLGLCQIHQLQGQACVREREGGRKCMGVCDEVSECE